jgi:putative ABC transport system permease protein
MFTYQVRLALKSLRRNPILAVVTIGGIGLGIAVAMTFVTAYYHLAGNPIPAKSDRLHYVQVDAWNPQRPWDDDDPTEPPDQLTYRDAVNISASTIPTYRSTNYKVEVTLHPAQPALRPFREVARMCLADFFPMFDVPFRHGGPWTRAMDENAEQVVVLGAATNQKLYGGENSVGRLLRIEDRDFRIVGVLDTWRPMPKFYDVLNDEFEAPEELYLPFALTPALELPSAGNSSGWGDCGTAFAALLESECTWIQMWVQLDDAEQRAAFAAYLDAYVDQQKALGRHGRPANNRLRDVMAWMRFQQVVPEQARALLIISLLFLVVCSVNLIGVLLGKFLARAHEVGVRRALGASRGWVFVQHVLECELIGILGGLVGLGLSTFGIKLLDKLFDQEFGFYIDLRLLAIAIGLALAAALLAGLYPAWRVCRLAPALHLKA